MKNKKAINKELFFYVILLIMLAVNLYSAEIKTVYMVLWRGETEAEKGFVDYLNSSGNNVRYIVRDCVKNKSRLKDFITEIKDIKPDLVYTFGTTVTSYIAGRWDEPESGLKDIPIVFNIVSDPVRAKIVEQDAFSTREVTGASHAVPMAVQINAIRRMTEVKKIAFIYNGSEKNSIYQKEIIEKFAESDSFRVISFDVKNSFNQKRLITFLEKNHPDIIYLPSDSYIISNAKEFINVFNELKYPVFSATEGPIRNNKALFGLVSRYYNVGQLAGYSASQILFNEIPASAIPVENLKRFSFIVNINTAKNVGLIPPLSIMKFAEIIEE